MATIYDLKPKFQAILRPTVSFLANKGVTPNQVTWVALVFSMLTGALIGFTHGASWVLLFVPIFMFIRMAMNAIDGILAKEFDMKTDAGAMLNEMSDVVADTVLYLPLAYVNGVSVVWVVLFVIVGIFTEMAGVLASTIGGERRYDGPMGKSDRAFIFGLICLLLGLGVSVGIWVTILLSISTLLGVITTFNRSKAVL
ncbi:CDP-alcohol phosphatidyltransferase family protein [Sulfurimonas sp.]|uniref:CDP-alcohol phosphatidyltransferase family protein n=1 Tax=Sulfurimonas sp. TaxID=2022749 RepID=UPI002B496762|nr:CDP-alcohol phosphatidyltransferase family protein [Sulfurimonas sp.]